MVKVLDNQIISKMERVILERNAFNKKVILMFQPKKKLFSKIKNMLSPSPRYLCIYMI